MHHKHAVILLLSLLACVAGCDRQANTTDNSLTTEMPQQTMPDDFPPKPAWKPNLPVDIDRTIKAFAYYTDHKVRFAVFQNGTCIVAPNDVSDPEAHTEAVLDKIYNYHADFNPLAMDDGNYTITYSQPGAASIVFADEYENNRDYIDRNHQDGVVRDEVLLNAEKQTNVFDDRGKIGLFGRARMFLDAQDPKIVHVYSPETN